MSFESFLKFKIKIHFTWSFERTLNVYLLRSSRVRCLIGPITCLVYSKLELWLAIEFQADKSKTTNEGKLSKPVILSSQPEFKLPPLLNSK